MNQFKRFKFIFIFSLNILLGILLGSIFFYRDLKKGALDLYAKGFQAETISDKELAALPLQKVLNKIADRNLPAVVSIRVVKSVRSNSQDFFQGDEFLKRFFGFRDNLPEEDRSAFGSGFIISSDGYLISNNHVVDGSIKIVVVFKDNDKEYEAKIVGQDVDTDVALLKIKNVNNLPHVTLGNSDSVNVGDITVAIGNPFGLSHTFTMGVISAKGRKGIGNTKYENFIQTDVAINPGNSGGPLINLKGEVIGINSMIYSKNGANIGIGFAIPVNMVKNIVRQLKETGSVVRGWLGISVQDINEKLADALSISKKGVYVPDVTDNSPADKAGIKKGDVVISYNQKQVKDSSDLINFVGNTKPGTVVEIELLKRGNPKKKIVIKVKIGQNKPLLSSSSSRGNLSQKYLGITVNNINQKTKERFSLKTSRGVVIENINKKSPLLQQGVRLGDVIVLVNHEEVNGISQYEKVMQRYHKKKKIIFHIQRGTSLYVVAIEN